MYCTTPCANTKSKELSGKRQGFPVGDAELAGQPLLLEICARQIDGRRCEIHADDLGASFGEPGQIDAGAAADFEHAASAIAVEVDEAQQMVQFFEVVLVEVVEKPARADGVRRDLEIVNVTVPVPRVRGRCLLRSRRYPREATILSRLAMARGMTLIRTR